jgi:hypothetical protein
MDVWRAHPRSSRLALSAKVALETVNQLQNGTLITHKTYNLIARDGQGRTHNEARNWMDPATGAEPRLTRVELYDPATRLRTNLYSGSADVSCPALVTALITLGWTWSCYPSRQV